MKCAICGKEMTKGFWFHVKSHGLTREEYEAKYSSEEITEEVESTEDVQQENIPQQEADPLTDLLKEYNITLAQLREILDRELSDKKEPEKSAADLILEDIKATADSATEQAMKMAGPDELTTNDLHIAEALDKVCGYYVTKVTSNPKTWHLRKRSLRRRD